MAEKVEEFILTTEIINEIEVKENLGKILKRYEKLWFSNLRGIRKANLIFAMTDDEDNTVVTVDPVAALSAGAYILIASTGIKSAASGTKMASNFVVNFTV